MLFDSSLRSHSQGISQKHDLIPGMSEICFECCKFVFHKFLKLFIGSNITYSLYILKLRWPYSLFQTIQSFTNSFFQFLNLMRLWFACSSRTQANGSQVQIADDHSRESRLRQQRMKSWNGTPNSMPFKHPVALRHLAVFPMAQTHRMFRLEGTFKIIESNHQPSTAMYITKPSP